MIFLASYISILLKTILILLDSNQFYYFFFFKDGHIFKWVVLLFEMDFWQTGQITFSFLPHLCLWTLAPSYDVDSNPQVVHIKYFGTSPFDLLSGAFKAGFCPGLTLNVTVPSWLFNWKEDRIVTGGGGAGTVSAVGAAGAAAAPLLCLLLIGRDGG